MPFALIETLDSDNLKLKLVRAASTTKRLRRRRVQQLSSANRASCKLHNAQQRAEPPTDSKAGLVHAAYWNFFMLAVGNG
jgi:hypothetical protein